MSDGTFSRVTVQFILGILVLGKLYVPLASTSALSRTIFIGNIEAA